MEPLWNQLNLNRPPTSSWETIPRNFDTTNFRQCIKKVYNDLESQDMLRTEAAILSRLIYRMKSKFRNDKGLKNMEKVNRALLNYLKLSLETDYKYLADIIAVTDYSVTLPTRQMLQYVLTRTQGFAKLMCRVETVAQTAANFLVTRIRLGQAWTVSVISYSVISRIWMFSRHLVKRCCVWYNSMYPYNEKLKLVGIDWMPTNYCLPSDLKMWLSVPWIDEQTTSLPTNEQLSDSIFNLIKHQDEVSGAQGELKFSVEEVSEESKSSPAPEPELCPVVHDDIGEPISRESLKNSPKRKKLSKKLKKIDVKDIKTKDDLSLLLTFDCCPGLDKLQWNIMKKMISKKLLKMDKCKNTKKQKILLDKVIQSIQDCMN